MSTTDPAVEIEAVGAAAAGRLARLQNAAFPDPWSARFVGSILHLSGTVAFLAHSDGRDLGYVLARAIAGEAEILSIAVETSARGRGVGERLLKRALETAAGLGAAKIHLEVSIDNAAARALYAQAGFAKAGLRKGYYADGTDALVLARPLSPADRRPEG